MTEPSAEVWAIVPLRLVIPPAGVALRATLRYAVEDPYAVDLGFPPAPSRGSITWMFARQLLAEGLVVPAGDGDVRIWPAPDELDAVVYLELSSPSGRALFAAPHEVLAEFVRRSEELVPPGTESEHLDVDAELNLLLHDHG